MTKKISFELPAELVAGAASGILLGEFNNWNPEEAIYLEKQQDGSMKTELTLKAGKTYEYRYLLSDGRWVNDNNAKAFPQQFGYSVQNCIISVPGIEKETVSKPRITKKKEEKIATDDLTKIEGIVKKVAILLNAENIKTFKDLSKCTIKKLQLLLDGAGSNFSIYNPATWPKQAKLAASGKWEELSKLQEDMKGMK